MRQRLTAMGLSLLLVTAGLAAVAPSASAAVVFESEDNDATSRANGLALGDTLRGTIEDYWDRDYFRVQVPSYGKLNLDFKFPENLGTGGVFDLTVINEDGVDLFNYDLQGAQYNGSWLQSQGTYVGKGTYYIYIDSGNSAAYGKQYSLTVNHSGFPVETEPNDDTASADLLTSGVKYYGAVSKYWDKDFFAIKASRGGTLIVDFRFASGLGTDAVYDVEVLDPFGNELSSWTYYGAHNALSTPMRVIVPAGRNYVRVSSGNSITYGRPYTLKLTAPQSSFATYAPTIAGTVANGRTVTANVKTWSPAPTTLKYQWLRNGAPISGATNKTYKVNAYDLGQKLTVRVTGSRSGYATTYRTSPAKTAPKLTLKTVTPVITGTVKNGSTVSVTRGTWTPAPVNYSYQWFRNGKAIPGATKNTYKVNAYDLGNKLTARVYGKKLGYSDTYRTTAAKVAPRYKFTSTPHPQITGTNRAGYTLRANPGAWRPGGNLTVQYQWLRNGSGIPNATKSTYKLNQYDKGQRVSVRVIVSKLGYEKTTRTSSARSIS